MTTVFDVSRFLARCDPEPMSGCWLWTGGMQSEGYGVVDAEGERQYAHRVSHVIYRGPIPDGWEVDHLCRVRSCVNPEHLEAVTKQENMRRMGRAQTTCRKAGHDWTDPRNVYTRPNGHRYCAECQRIAVREAHRV